MDDRGKRCSFCAKACSLTCSRCGKVSYCGQEHQKAHWKVHKLVCYAIRVHVDEVSLGRCLIATKDFHPGDLILKEAALLKLPDGLFGQTTFQSTCCRDCCRSKPTNAENESFVFSEPFNPRKMDYATGIQILECLLLKEKDPEKWKQVTSLESRIATIKEIPKHSKLMEKAVNFIKYLRGMTKFSVKEIELVYGVIFLNAYGRHFDACDEYPASHRNSVYLYWYGSAVLHSCIPNAVCSISTSGDFLLKATKEIKKGDQITVTHVNLLLGTVARRQQMKEHLITCSCSRCADPTELGTYFSAMVCQVCGNGHLLLDDPMSSDAPSDWRCDDCGDVQSHDDVGTILDEIKKELEEVMIPGTSPRSLAVIERIEMFLIEHAGKKLHPNHYFIVWAACHMMQKTWNRFLNFIFIRGKREYLARQMMVNAKNGLAIGDALLPGKTLFRGISLAYLYMGYYYILACSSEFRSEALLHEAWKSEILKSKARAGYENVEFVLREAMDILTRQPKRSLGWEISSSLEGDLDHYISK